MFRIEHTDGSARCGTLTTNHGTVKTPTYMPVATKGSVKLLTPTMLRDMGVEAIISNSFLLGLRPGTDIIEEHGGLHSFMGWNGTVFTDSGGFQMIRSDFLQGIKEEGPIFRSPYDGRRMTYTPEMAAETQAALGSDVAMMLDLCPPYPATEEQMVDSVTYTTTWARRFLERYREVGRGLAFGITQGGTNYKLRQRSSAEITILDFDGYAIGGLSIGESREEMFSSLEASVSLLPEDKPRYFMGLGSPLDIIKAVGMGVDVFDSVFATRNARHGTAYTSVGRINLGKGRYDRDMSPLDPGCDCYVCKTYTRAYLNHLMREHEYTGMHYLTYHNIYFMANLMSQIRLAVEEGALRELEGAYAAYYGPS